MRWLEYLTIFRSKCNNLNWNILRYLHSMFWLLGVSFTSNADMVCAWIMSKPYVKASETLTILYCFAWFRESIRVFRLSRFRCFGRMRESVYGVWWRIQWQAASCDGLQMNTGKEMDHVKRFFLFSMFAQEMTFWIAFSNDLEFIEKENVNIWISIKKIFLIYFLQKAASMKTFLKVLIYFTELEE